MHTRLPSVHSWRFGLPWETVPRPEDHRSPESQLGPGVTSSSGEGISGCAHPGSPCMHCWASDGWAGEGGKEGKEWAEELASRWGPMTGLPSWSSHRIYFYIMVLGWLSVGSYVWVFHYIIKSLGSGSLGLACSVFSCQLDEWHQSAGIKNVAHMLYTSFF